MSERSGCTGCLSLLFTAACLLACLLAGIAIVGRFFYPVSTPLSRYDFSTPREALKSDFKIALTGDGDAEIELRRLKNDFLRKDDWKTLEVRQERPFGSKVVLFYTIKDKKGTKFQTRVMKQDFDTGYWIDDQSGPWKVEETDKGLAEEMRQWEAKSEGEKVK